MVGAKRARTAETPKQPSLCLRLRASYFYPTNSVAVVRRYTLSRVRRRLGLLALPTVALAVAVPNVGIGFWPATAIVDAILFMALADKRVARSSARMWPWAMRMRSMTNVFRDLEEQAVFEEWASLRRDSRRSISRAANFADAIGLGELIARTSLLGVVGSKGKGTACVYASAILAAASHRVGTITSPGLRSNHDRIRIDGAVLAPDIYRGMLLRIRNVRAAVPAPSAADGYLSPNGLFMLGGIATLVDNGCDAVVVEAGIGGKSDELSLLPLTVVIVTQIFLEHQEILGRTLTEIARDKTGAISRLTREVFSLDQSSEAASEIANKCEEIGAKLTWVKHAYGRDSDLSFPPGYGRMNAVAGVRGGSALSKLIDGKEIDSNALAQVLASVKYPGRLSEHHTDNGRVIVDSAISRDGLVSSLFFARTRFGREPDTILVSLPVDKDFEGFRLKLGGSPAAKVFVNMPGIHLPYPSRSDWPWDWADADDLPDLLQRGVVLAVGTVLFSGSVLRVLDVNTDSIFDPTTSQ
jgi:dihydrofolate synthase/folylpolyglutamate synthase